MLSSIFIGCDGLQSKRFFTPSNKKNTVKSGQSAVQGSVAGLLLKRSLDIMFQSLSVSVACAGSTVPKRCSDHFRSRVKSQLWMLLLFEQDVQRAPHRDDPEEQIGQWNEPVWFFWFHLTLHKSSLWVFRIRKGFEPWAKMLMWTDQV